jgi:predicted RNase H-like HicB family nuclease
VALQRIEWRVSRYNPFSTVPAPVHRFEESIAGRAYLIEVASVAHDRWRAYIVRVPGVPTALMPFYGATPAEAAQNLSEWLTRAHAQAVARPSV